MAIATSSISGLASGLDTASIIDQLMQLEAAPQDSLKTRLTTEQSSLASLQTLNAKVASLITKAADLAKPTAWSPLTATSSNSDVTVRTSAGATAASISLTVVQTATSSQLHFDTAAGLAGLNDIVTSGSTDVLLTVGGETLPPIKTGDGSLKGLVAALNASGTGVHASLVKISGTTADDSKYRLQVVSDATGEDESLALTNTDGSPLLGAAGLSGGRDAEIAVGADTIRSSSNTFSGLMPGVDVILASTAESGDSSTVAVARDSKSMSDSVQSLVDAVNFVLSDIASLTAYDSTTKVSGPLVGESSVRSLRDQLLNSIYPADGTSLASAGIQVDRSGNLTFDAAKFTGAYEADPAGIAAKFTTSDSAPGFAARVQAVAKGASDPGTGSLTAVISGRNSTIKEMQGSIDDWDTRLALRRDTLNQQYTAMETLMNTLKSQSSWLTSQISALPTNNKAS